MKVKVSEATNLQLDWMVAKALGASEDTLESYVDGLREAGDGDYSTDWSQGGPIIEREHISTTCDHSGIWVAYSLWNYADVRQFMQGGSTPLVAAMRCYVTSKLGEEVEVPDELA